MSDAVVCTLILLLIVTVSYFKGFDDGYKKAIDDMKKMPRK